MKIKNIARTIMAADAGYTAYKRRANKVSRFSIKKVGSKYHIYAHIPPAPPKLVGRYTDCDQAYKAYAFLKAVE